MKDDLTALADRQLQLLHERLDGIVFEHKPPRDKIFAALEAKMEQAIARAMSFVSKVDNGRPLLPPVVSPKGQSATLVRFDGGAKRKQMFTPQAPNLVSAAANGVDLLHVISTSCLDGCIVMKMI